MAPQEQRHQIQPQAVVEQPSQSWESLDDLTYISDDDDDQIPLLTGTIRTNDIIDVEIALDDDDDDDAGVHSNKGIDDDDKDLEDIEENEESIRLFYDEFCQHKRPPIRHLSISEMSNESSPLLNPLKSMPKGTPSKFWFHRLWRWYNQRLNHRPVVTKSITAGIIVTLGDLVGQILDITASSSSYTEADEQQTQTKFDFVRLARFCSMGMFLQAPITHYYYVALDHYLPPTINPWTCTTMYKLIIDQTIYAPIFLLSVFIYLGILDGDSISKIWQQQIQTEYISTMIANWKLWIPATLINMAYISPQFRVLYCNAIFFVWSIFLSIILNGNVPTSG